MGDILASLTLKGTNLKSWSKRSLKKFQRNELPVLAKIAGQVLSEAKRNSPVATGALRASGRMERGGPTSYLVMFGGGGTGVNYAAAVEFGSSTRGPKPFLRPAVFKVLPQAKREIARMVQKSLGK
jgi:HK97 gp10 family phage protein